MLSLQTFAQAEDSTTESSSWTDYIPGWDWLKSIRDYLSNFIAYLYDALSDFFWSIIDSGIATAIELLTSAVDLIVGIIPDNFNEKIAAVSDYYGIANTWLPLSFGLSLILAYIGFITAILIVRWVQEWIRNLIP